VGLLILARAAADIAARWGEIWAQVQTTTAKLINNETQTQQSESLKPGKPNQHSKAAAQPLAGARAFS
jgi:hypothetical protein